MESGVARRRGYCRWCNTLRDEHRKREQDGRHEPRGQRFPSRHAMAVDLSGQIGWKIASQKQFEHDVDLRVRGTRLGNA